MTTLAEMLRDNRGPCAAERRAERARLEAENIQLRKQRDSLAMFLNSLYDYIEQAICQGKEPCVKIKAYEHRTWVIDAMNQNKGVKHLDLWESFVLRLANQGLQPQIHDGVGQDSWIVLTVRIVA